MKIALGTTSKLKKEFLAEVLKELKVEAELIATEVDSGVSDQPLTSRETKQGSVNRAKGALHKINLADFAVGIEVGYHPNLKGQYEMFCWATIVGADKNRVSAQSNKLLLPIFHQNVLKDNKYLGEYVGEYVKKASSGVEAHVGEIIRFRKPFIQAAVKSALINYLVK